MMESRNKSGLSENPGRFLRFLREKHRPSVSCYWLNQVLTFLGLIGVIVDPTTAGVGDSDRAMGYI